MPAFHGFAWFKTKQKNYFQNICTASLAVGVYAIPLSLFFFKLGDKFNIFALKMILTLTFLYVPFVKYFFTHLSLMLL